MAAESSLPRSSRSQRSASVPSIADSASNSGIATATTIPHPPPQAMRGQTTMPLAQPAAQMSIGSIIEPSRGNDFGQHFPNDLSHLAVGVGPRTLPTTEMLYGGTIPGTAESPMYSSDSCYSPMSDYHLQQPQIGSSSSNTTTTTGSNGHRYMSQDVVTSRPQTGTTTSLESYYQPQLMTTTTTTASPLSGVVVGSSAFPVWDHFDPSVLGTPLEEGSYLPTVGIFHPSIYI